MATPEHEASLAEIEAAHRYILSSWAKARHEPSNDPRDPYALPFPFVPPSISGEFKWLFYWDTFFTNRGLIDDGHLDWAEDNVRNLVALLDRYGHVPNANSYSGVKFCSQPPYLHFMLDDIVEVEPQREWLFESYRALKKEYAFWMKERLTPCGLNRHYCLPCSVEDLAGYYDYVAQQRLPLERNLPPEEKAALAPNYIAEAESGLDFTPRFLSEGASCCPADLNGNLYGLECDLFDLGKRLGDAEAAAFQKAAVARKEKMDQLLLGKDGLYYDYNFVKKALVRPISFSGQFLPFIVGLSQNKGALRLLLERLLCPHGIVSAEKDEGVRFAYQANYPYSWPYDNYLAFWALRKENLAPEAREVAFRYVSNVAQAYKETHLLWETYDPFQGGVAKKSEYPAQEMLGWTAGSFEEMYYYLKKDGGFARDN